MRHLKSPPTTTSRPSPWRAVINNLPLNDPLITKPALALPSPLCSFPFFAVSFSALYLLSLALDIADSVTALATDLLGERDEIFDFVLSGC
jgi:hypothetical protein